MNILISGASSGIGNALALHLAQRHTVWAGVRTQKDFDELASSKDKAQGLIPIFLDVTENASIDAAVTEIRMTAGTMDVLINNAGVSLGGPIEALSLDIWRHQFNVNFFGLIELTKACLPMLRMAKGRIVNMSSIAGRLAYPYMAPYSASKFAVESFSDSLRRELRSMGISVAIIEPGSIATPIWKKGLIIKNDMRSNLTPELEKIYGPSIENFSKVFETAARHADPVSLVVTAVERALMASKPKTRYTVGRGVGRLSYLVTLLPGAWIDRWIEKHT